MALTITIEGKGIIANANAYSSDSAGGTWGELGGGTIGFNPDVYIYGSGSIGNKYASKSGYSYYNTPTALDFDVAGTEEGQFIYIWVNIQSKGPFDTLANNGFSIRVGTSLSDYRDFKIAGKNDANGWAGGWKCFVIDPTKPGSVADTGTFDVGNVNYIGLWVDTDVSVRADSIFIDQIAVGSGLRITGTSTAGWKDIVDYCTAYASRAWGMFEEREGVYYCKGKIYIGDSTQTAITSFADTGRIIKFETSEYYNISDVWVSSLPADACGIVVEDAASYTTTFSDGVIVGADNGRAGSIIIGNENEDVSIDLYGGNNAASVPTLYGTTFKSIYGAFNSGNNAQHKFLGCSFTNCSQFDPVGAPALRNCTFAETADVDAAILWNEDIDIQYCNFIANITGAAIEHPSAAGTPYSHVGHVFSGNTHDVLNSSGSAITINNSGTPKSNGSSSEGSSVTFQTAIDVIITVQDENTDLLQDVQVGVYKTSDRTELINKDTNASGIAQESYSGGATDIEIRCRKASSGATKYENFSTLGTTGTGDYTLLVTLKEDPNNNATT